MFKAGFEDLKRRRQIEDRPSVLHGDDPASREALAVADRVHGVDDRLARIAGTQKIGVQRMDVSFGRNRLFSGAECLTDDLTAEHSTPSEVLALAPEDVLFDSLEAKDADELLKLLALRHRAHTTSLPAL